MDVGVICGGMAMGGAPELGGAAAGSLVGQVVPGCAPPPTTVGEALAGQLHGGIEQLAAMEKDDEDKSGGGAAMGHHVAIWPIVRVRHPVADQRAYI